MASLPGYISDTELYYEETEIETKNNLLTGTGLTVEGRDNVMHGDGGTVHGDRVALFNMMSGNPYEYDGSDAFIVRAGTILFNGSPLSSSADINALLDGLGT